MPLRIETIISEKNVKVKNLISRQNDHYIFEGEKLVHDILKNGFAPSVIILNSDISDKFIDIVPRKTSIWLVTEKIMKKISSLKSPPGAISVFEILPQNNSVYNEQIIFAVDNIQDPGNLGSLFRCAAAFGFVSLVLTGECVKLTNSKFLRTAQNSVFYISVKKFDSLENFLSEAQNKKYHIYLTSSHSKEKQSAIKNIKLPAVIVIGNEGRGVSEDLMGKYPSLSLDQTGLVESLNAGVSGCILMNLISERFGLIKD